MVKIANSLLAIAGLCASLVRVNADVVINEPVAAVASGVTQVGSASLLGASAISTQAGGATVYLATEVDTFLGFASGGHTSTVLSTPSTTVFTLVEASSVFSISAPIVTTLAGNVVASGDEETTCTGTGNGGQVDCVQEIEVSAGGVATTAVIDFVATTSPVFTITGSGTGAVSVTGGSAAPTSSANTSPAKNAASHIIVSLTSTSLLGLMGFIFVFL
ncbi:hypothetical protein HYPSUDRAFT_202196 [Hypholoma sublateritium FD-334 SS-4]|uniref:Uncharacterized protein n=1 Tax=Hypholoma sublateritium (strain FD-334 SS-4) TaxID=945553 RepID=A0A0D2PRB0_HYPSF|nr:hypothetical protein HYPSUDRAFT_202196 [Hypholoma sublateritium FD-334 SS-4]